MMKCGLVRSLVFLAVLVCVSGCENDSGDDRAPAVGVDVHGKWRGYFYLEGHSGSGEAIDVTIKQDGSALEISTTKASPPGQHFTGTISENAYVRLTDTSDGEMWTTHNERASENHMRISDFIRAPTLDDPAPPRNIIDLDR